MRSGLHIAIISGARTENIRERYRMLGIEDIYLGASHKLPVLKDWMAAKGLNPEEVAFVGDDIPDIPPMDFVGLAVAAAHCQLQGIAILYVHHALRLAVVGHGHGGWRKHAVDIEGNGAEKR